MGLQILRVVLDGPALISHQCSQGHIRVLTHIRQLENAISSIADVMLEFTFLGERKMFLCKPFH